MALESLPEPERSCATCIHAADDPCPYTAPHLLPCSEWRPSGVQFAAPKLGFMEGLYSRCATNRADVAPMNGDSFAKWFREMLADARKESPMVESTWLVEVVQVTRQGAGKWPAVTYLLAPTFITGKFTEEAAKRNALLMAAEANPGVDVTGDDVEVHVARPFRGQ